MKLSVTTYNTTITIETDRDDQDGDTFINYVRKLMLAMGYHPNTVEECLGGE